MILLKMRTLVNLNLSPTTNPMNGYILLRIYAFAKNKKTM